MKEKLSNINGTLVYCNDKPVVKLFYDGAAVRVIRLPASTIGEWLSVISYLEDIGYKVK